VTPRRLAACAALLTAACGARVPLSELPEAPIAVVHRSPEQSRRHAEAMGDLEQPAGSTQRTSIYGTPEAIARVEDISRYFKRVVSGATDDATANRFPGRLGLLHPRSGRIEPVAAAWGEAIPHDWSADRSRLLLSALVDSYAQLFELELASGELRPVTRGPDVHPGGCFGPNGSTVMMTARVVGAEVESRIEILEPGNPTPRALTAGPHDYSPTCAPDGSSVVYLTAPKRGVVWLMSLELRPEALPRRLGPGLEPRFCADGEWIVYSAPIRRGTKLWRVRADGSGRSPIGDGVLDEKAPACSPDGRFLVYGVTEDHLERLYLRRFDGSGDTLLYADADVWHPVW
jgi:Tol biopolymer transport system component